MNNLRQITDEALDLIDATTDHIGRLTALMTAIRADAKHNKGRDLEKLTGLGQYLSSDWDHYLDGQSKRLRGQLDVMEASL
ncbi:hypothetical protein [Pseudomonas sp. GL-B-19]|uniref:hypothetical protein n=1 Tax=Pseudomonas sp. GL-B-19 TaxID=2832393 RepID=UPI001CBD5237|nr:hypothetical protein [Pseudomonas sp. GL-B-19]